MNKKIFRGPLQHNVVFTADGPKTVTSVSRFHPDDDEISDDDRDTDRPGAEKPILRPMATGGADGGKGRDESPADVTSDMNAFLRRESGIARERSLRQRG
jgi:hypothetical protein